METTTATDAAPADSTAPRRDTDGNHRMLAAAGLALLVGLAIEYGTLLLGLDSGWIGEHVFFGLVLIPIVAWKLVVVAYRFGRYYTHDPDYVRAGPPRLLLRLLAPLLVLAIVVLLGSGVLLVTGNHHADEQLLRQLHQASYLLLSATVAVHVLAYVLRSVRMFVADLLANTPRSWLRLGAIVIVIGVALGFAQLLPHRSGGDRGRDRGRDRFDTRTSSPPARSDGDGGSGEVGQG